MELMALLPALAGFFVRMYLAGRFRPMSVGINSAERSISSLGI